MNDTASLPPKDQPLSWAQTRALMRRDFARVLPFMGDSASLPRRLFWFFLPTFQGLFLYRLSRHAYVNGWRNLAQLLFVFNQYATRIDIPPSTSIGGGCLLGHSPVILCGRIGENFTMMGMGGIGGGFDDKDIGGGPGLPVIGDNVVFAFRAIVLGAVRVGDGARLGPTSTVMRDVPPGGVVAAPASRITRGSDDTAAGGGAE